VLCCETQRVCVCARARVCARACVRVSVNREGLAIDRIHITLRIPKVWDSTTGVPKQSLANTS